MPADGLVGREAEVSELEAFLRRMPAGFSAFGIEGEAGIGKTTLWHEARRRAAHAGTTVLSCRPAEAEVKFSFAGVADLLAPVPESDLAALPRPQREALEVALLDGSVGDRTTVGRAVSAGFLTLLRELAGRGPLVLAIDDVQWLDIPSKHVLDFAARRLESEPVGLLYALRLPAPRRPFAGAVPDERARRLTLGALSLAALGLIISSRMGIPLPRPLLARIKQACGGNPFYALEIAHLVQERGLDRAPASELPVPDDLQALTAARISRLPDQTRDALLLAAVMGNSDGSSIQLDALAPAEEAGIVSVDQAGVVEFTHPLFAAAVLASVTSGRRRALHRRAAELVADFEPRVRHIALGAAEPDAALAALLDDAAASAERRGAPDAAAELAELAVGRTPAEDREARGMRLLAAGWFHCDAGDLARAEQLAQRARLEAGSPGLRARALQLLAQLHGRRNDFSEAARLASSGLPLAAGDPGLEAGLELELAFCCSSLGNFPETERHARAAVECARAAEERGRLGEALAVLAMAQFLRGGGVATDQLAQALELEGLGRSGSLVMRPRFIHGLILLWTGELEAAAETLLALRDETVARGQESALPLLSLYLVWAAVWRGDLHQAAELAEPAREAAAVLADPLASATVLSAAAILDAHAGETERARRQAASALELFERLRWRSGVIWPLWALGTAELIDGNFAVVDRLLGPLADQLSDMGAGDPVLAMFLPDEIEALIALGELGRANGYLEAFERSAAELDRAWALAAAARCRGALLIAEGHSKPAFSAFDEALARYGEVGMPLERARTLLLAGQARRRHKQRGQAGKALTEALAEFERAGALGWAAKARAELSRVGSRTTSDEELTATERRAAELAASGLSNQEVAERMFVSVKTVEANLTRAYRKLGVRSRVGLANVMRAKEG